MQAKHGNILWTLLCPVLHERFVAHLIPAVLAHYSVTPRTPAMTTYNFFDPLRILHFTELYIMSIYLGYLYIYFIVITIKACVLHAVSV